MPIKQLREFLDGKGVKYVTISHSPAFTAQEIAATAHIPGKDLAKTVIVTVDGKLAMAVLPASSKVDLERLRGSLDATRVELVAERDFRDKFPDCEPGAMPPFGNLYGMSVYVATRLAEDDEIAFNAGSHNELIRLRYADFENLVRPMRIHLASRN